MLPSPYHPSIIDSGSHRRSRPDIAEWLRAARRPQGDRGVLTTLSRRPRTSYERPLTDILGTPGTLEHGLGSDEREDSILHLSAPPAARS